MLHPHQNALDLRREYVDALDNHHVVGAPHHLIHTRVGAPTCTGLIIDAGDVLGAVAQDWHSFARQRGDHQLAYLARPFALQGILVDDLRQEVVLCEVQPTAQFALAGNARAAEFGHAVVVGDKHM